MAKANGFSLHAGVSRDATEEFVGTAFFGPGFEDERKRSPRSRIVSLTGPSGLAVNHDFYGVLGVTRCVKRRDDFG